MRAALGMKNNVPTSEPGVKKQVTVPNAINLSRKSNGIDDI